MSKNFKIIVSKSVSALIIVLNVRCSRDELMGYPISTVVGMITNMALVLSAKKTTFGWAMNSFTT